MFISMSLCLVFTEHNILKLDNFHWFYCDGFGILLPLPYLALLT